VLATPVGTTLVAVLDVPDIGHIDFRPEAGADDDFDDAYARVERFPDDAVASV
jgi:hypothetical protein